MALKKNRINQRHPRTGVTSYEQLAKNFKNKEVQTDLSSLTEGEKKIYQLVESTVDYAGDQFSDNLRFNNYVLTDILYDNLYYLLGEKFK